MSENDFEDVMIEGDEDNSGENKYLLFNLGEEVYGINIGSVTGIEEMQKITSVPDMPEYIRGVINLRGKVIPVMDLRLRFGMPFREYDDRTCMIIVDVDSKSTGFIVDTVAEVHDIYPKDIEEAPSFSGAEQKEAYISGLGKVGEEVRILLDVEKILTGEDIDSIEEKLR